MAIDTMRTLAENFLKGMFDVLDAMFSLSIEYALGDVNEIAPSTLRDLLARCPVVLRVESKSGGPLALLLPAAEASRFASLVQGRGPQAKPTLESQDLELLRDFADAGLGAGMAALLERAGRPLETPKDLDVAVLRPDATDRLAAFLGPPATACVFTFSAPEFRGQAVLLFSRHIENLAPRAQNETPNAQPGAPVACAQISAAEMTDILSGFDFDDTGEEADDEQVASSATDEQVASSATDVRVKSEPARGASAPNLDVLLDIRLVATARLGRVEMPIAEILNLGAGSIVNIGHLVDEPVELLVNGRLVARGDVVVADGKFGIRITEIVSPQERIESLH